MAWRNGMRTWKRAVSPGSYDAFSGITSIRSVFSPPNQRSSSRVTHTDVDAFDARPSPSFATAISCTLPACESVASHASRPCASVLPEHSTPSSRVSLWLSYA
ncbi:hypothetical protein DO71_1986 [Burkholderia pseudomallei]|nr:hypothetical protein DO71_1986 [Burkholderia pseudomallei]